MNDLKSKGTINYGLQCLTLVDQMFPIGKYFGDPQRPLIKYKYLLQQFSETIASKSTICKWFWYSLPYKASVRKSSMFSHHKYSMNNMYRMTTYIQTVSRISPEQLVFTDEKPIRGADVYQKKQEDVPLQEIHRL